MSLWPHPERTPCECPTRWEVLEWMGKQSRGDGRGDILYKEEPWWNDAQAFGAEHALAKKIGATFPGEGVYGFDLWWRGLRIDVKLNHRNLGRKCWLCVKKDTEPKSRGEFADAYVLLTGTFPDYFILGGATRAFVESCPVVTDFGPPFYKVLPDQLVPIDALREIDLDTWAL